MARYMLENAQTMQLSLAAAKKLPRLPKGRPTLDEQAAVTDKILLIARSTFIEMGLGNAAMEVIASRAKISKTTLYKRFPDKLSLFEAVIQRSIEEWSEGAKFHAPSNATTLEGEIRHIVTIHVRAMVQSDFMDIARLITAEAATFPNLSRIMHDKTQVDRIDAVVKKIEHYAKVDGVPCKDPASAVEALRSMTSGWIQMIESSQKTFGPAEQHELVERIVQLFMASRPVW